MSGAAVRLNDPVGEIFPSVDFEVFVVLLQRRVVVLAFALDRVGQRYEAVASSRAKGWRSASAGAGQVRTCDQSQNGKGAWPRYPAVRFRGEADLRNAALMSANDPLQSSARPKFRAAASPDLMLANPLCCPSG